MRSLVNFSRLELASLVCEHLKQAGVNVILSGGSCVSIYSSEKYVSKDLDFIDVSLSSNKKIARALTELGFENKPKNSRHFVHADTPLSVEFPSAPLTVGDEYIPSSAANKLETKHGSLRLLSPTDCVKDRLANFYYFGDAQCLEQAILVAKTHPINLKSIERWHNNEGQENGYANFITKLSSVD